MQGYWEKLQALVAGGVPFVAVTLVDVVASAPAVVGSKMLVTAEGLHFGTVGGGKVEMKALGEAREMLRGPSSVVSGQWRGEGPGEGETGRQVDREMGRDGGRQTSRFVEWNLQRDVGMTCGGVVRLYFEAYNVATWPILIFGAGHCAQALVRLLLTMQCQVTVIDPRAEWLEKLPGEGGGTGGAVGGTAGGKLRKIHAVRPMAEYVAEISAGAFVLMMTMGHATDQPILIEILQRRFGEFRYVGVIGSEAKAATLRRGVLAAGVPEERLGGYVCPIGLPIGTNDPAEIAVSVAAQLLERRGK